MSQVYSVMPALEIPANAREMVLNRKKMVRRSICKTLSSLAFGSCCTLECICFTIVFLYGIFEFRYFEAFEYTVVIMGVCVFYALLLFPTLFFNLKTMKLYGIPIVHGYTKDILYTASFYSQSAVRWEICTNYKETKELFYFYSESRWHIIPKEVWTEDELNELRAIMREKIGKRSRI